LGFHWRSFGKLELQFYNIRQIMQHTGELCERLGAHGEVEVGWLGELQAGFVRTSPGSNCPQGVSGPQNKQIQEYILGAYQPPKC